MSFETAVGNRVVDDNTEIFYSFSIKTLIHLNSCNEVIVSFMEKLETISQNYHQYSIYLRCKFDSVCSMHDMKSEKCRKVIDLNYCHT